MLLITFGYLISKNLDVNLAVNNLLSRDEDDGDDDDNPEYLPGGELPAAVSHLFN